MLNIKKYFSILMIGSLFLMSSCMDFSSEGTAAVDLAPLIEKQELKWQKDNNKRANNLLNAEIADPGGGSKAGGDSAMCRLSEFVQKPIEAAEDDAPPIWGKPKDSHIKKANRLIELVDVDPDEVKIDDPPKHKSKRHTAELKFIKQFKNKLDDESFIDEVSLQYVENPTIEVEIDNKQTLINQLLSIPSNKDKMKELEEELKKLKDELTFHIVGEA